MLPTDDFQNCLSILERFPTFNKIEQVGNTDKALLFNSVLRPLSFVFRMLLCTSLPLFLPRNKTEILHSNSLWLTNLKICSLKLLMMFVSKWVRMGIYLCLMRFILFFFRFANSFGKSCTLDAHDWKICYFSNKTNISLCSNLSPAWQQCFCCCNISRMHLLCNTWCLVLKLY